MSNVVFPPLIRYKGALASKATVFLAGTIDMGDSLDWQEKASTVIGPIAEIIYNPRRPAWDSSWEQTIDSEAFNNQAHWELDMIERADFVLVNYLPGSQSPVTMAEFGLCCALKPRQTIVCCPQGFWRKGNIDIMGERYGIPVYEDLDRALVDLNRRLELASLAGRQVSRG
ncbi:nucleoside 2-deoxyribosyltransferase-like protein [Brevundimonas phage vB_BpoS-Marchewka]|uniref:Nucleoside 2-deoxyribosyltransferase-like protein n=1 Tax=Brevundimonas phage vB_BpoS-Marchewka TaxID=2948604 RepID=A0A9E7N5U4_9CAUD|nr:nucleoside 2-deoxyribosyltransferase-like protein [Brevundimonas phage vB_BpoS-Marchewka]